MEIATTRLDIFGIYQTHLFIIPPNYPSSPISLAFYQDNEDTDEKDAAQLSRQLEKFVRVQPKESNLALPGSYEDYTEHGRGGYNIKTSEVEGDDDGTLPIPRNQSCNDPNAADRTKCLEEDEIKVTEFMKNLTTEGENDTFRKEIR